MTLYQFHHDPIDHFVSVELTAHGTDGWTPERFEAFHAAYQQLIDVATRDSQWQPEFTVNLTPDGRAAILAAAGDPGWQCAQEPEPEPEPHDALYNDFVATREALTAKDHAFPYETSGDATEPDWDHAFDEDPGPAESATEVNDEDELNDTQLEIALLRLLNEEDLAANGRETAITRTVADHLDIRPTEVRRLISSAAAAGRVTTVTNGGRRLSYLGITKAGETYLNSMAS